MTDEHKSQSCIESPLTLISMNTQSPSERNSIEIGLHPLMGKPEFYGVDKNLQDSGCSVEHGSGAELHNFYEVQ